MKYLVKGKKRGIGEGCFPNCPGYDECGFYEGCTNLMYCPFPDAPKTFPGRKKEQK